MRKCIGLLAILLLSIAGCGGGSELTGKWRAQNRMSPAFRLECSELNFVDGKTVVTAKGNRYPFELLGGQLRILFPDSDGPKTAKYTLRPGLLTIEFEGRDYDYDRVSE